MAIFDFFRKSKEEENREGSQGDLTDLVTLKEEEEKLIELKDRWIKNWESAEGFDKIKINQDRNERYWLGLQWDGNRGLISEEDRLVDNLIFESLEEALPIYTRQVAEPVVRISDPEGKETQKKIADKIYDIADVTRLRLKVKKTVRYWALYYLGIVKIGWSEVRNEIAFQAIRPQDLILDAEAVTDECEYQGDYIGHKRIDTAEALSKKFPKKAKEIKSEVKNKMGTKIKYVEWWTEEIVFWTLKSIVLEKAENPHWNYDREETDSIFDEFGNATETKQTVPGKNHFSSRKMPFAFLSVFNLGRSPYDATSLVEQTISLQDKLNKRLRQIDDNADRTNGGVVLSGVSFSKEQAAEAARTFALGGAIRIPDGNMNSYKRDSAPPLPQFIYQDLIDSRNEIRGIFGVTGLSAQGIKSEETVRGKILVKGQDTDRSSLIVDHIEQFYDYIFNWIVQMMIVYYKDQRPISRSQGGETISSEEMIFPMIVSVKEGSLIPKDRLTQRNEAVDLWAQGALDPISLYERLEFPNPEKSARDLFLWRNNPIALFPDLQGQVAPVIPGAVPGGTALPAERQDQGRSNLLAEVPIT